MCVTWRFRRWKQVGALLSLWVPTALLGGHALGQQAVPECLLEKEFEGWRVTAWHTHASISLPRDKALPTPDRYEFYQRIWLSIGSSGKMSRDAEAEFIRPNGSVQRLPAKGPAAIILDAGSRETFKLSGEFSFKSFPASPTYPAKGYAAVDVVEFNFPIGSQESSFVDFLTKADRENRDVQVSVLAKDQTMFQYAFRASGFQNAHAWPVGAFKELAAQLRAKKCEEPCLFGLC
jgi:hypothetical protein